MDSKQIVAFSALALLLSTPLTAAAGADDVERFAKCYQQFTGEIVSPKDSRLQAVKSGSISGTEACRQVLASANLVGGSLTAGGTREEGKKILHTFTVLGNSFFTNLPVKDERQRLYYDQNDRSYYLLNAIFSTDGSGRSNYPFSKVFQDTVTYRADRETVAPPNGYRLGSFFPVNFNLYDVFAVYRLCSPDYGTWVECANLNSSYQLIDQRIFDKAQIDVSGGTLRALNPQSSYLRNDGKLFSDGGYEIVGSHDALLTTQTWPWALEETAKLGKIVGIRPTTAKSVPHAFQRLFNDSDGYYRNYLGPAFNQPYPAPIDNFYNNLGAGMLFTPNYQESLGMDRDQILMQNGVNQVPRRWAQDFFKDFLCREIPVIRQADAFPHVERVVNQKAPFRSSVSCMRCHASTDALAFISRNYQLVKTAPLHGAGIMVNRIYRPTKEDVSALAAEPDDFFPVRPPRGNLRYRDYAGTYHNVDLNAPASDPTAVYAQLGQYLSRMDDPYVCMTSRYFKYLTGVDVKFYDPADPETPALSAREKQLQNYLIGLGKELKQTGDLRRTMMRIVSSELFLDPNGTSAESR